MCADRMPAADPRREAERPTENRLGALRVVRPESAHVVFTRRHIKHGSVPEDEPERQKRLRRRAKMVIPNRRIRRRTWNYRGRTRRSEPHPAE